MSKVDFLPDDYLEKKSQKRTNVICLTLFIVIMTAVGAGFIITEKQQRAVDQEARQVNQQLAAIGESINTLEKLEDDKQKMLERAAIIASLMESVPRSLLLAMVTNYLPDGVSLVEFELETKESIIKQASSKKTEKTSDQKKPLRTISKTDTKIELVGLAMTNRQVANYISNLAESRLLGEVNLLYSKEEKAENGIMYKFKLATQLAPSARANEQDAQLVRQRSGSTLGKLFKAWN